MSHCILLLLAACAGVALSHAQGLDLRAAFASSPPDTRPGCYYPSSGGLKPVPTGSNYRAKDFQDVIWWNDRFTLKPIIT